MNIGNIIHSYNRSEQKGENKMKMTGLLFALLLVFAGVASAQTGEVFGGYSYLNVDTNGLTSRQNASGFEVAADGNIRPWFAIESDFSVYFKTFTIPPAAYIFYLPETVKITDFNFGAGPRFNYGPLFVHALVGFDRLTGEINGYSASQDSFSYILGGGIQKRIRGNWSVRVSGDYVASNHNLTGSGSYQQNNFRASAGIVYSFGGGRTSSNSPTPKPDRNQVNSETEPVFGIIGYPSEHGFMVTSVELGALGQLAGIEKGSIIMRIDGRPVRTAAEIGYAFAANKTDSITISYLFAGAFLTDRTVKKPIQ